MIVEIKLETLLDQTKEGKIGKINKKPGDRVEPDDVICEVESNKSNISVKSNTAGVIKTLYIEEGSTIRLGDSIAEIEGEVSGYNYFSSHTKHKKEDIECDIAIIGGGPGGYVAAIQAAKLGAKVALVEKGQLGGTCLNWGCIPTKALVRSSEVFTNLLKAEEFGLHAERITVDMQNVIKRKNNIVKQLVQGIEALISNNNIMLVRGLGNIVDKKTVLVRNEMSEITIRSNNIIIATGSAAMNIPIPGSNLKNVLSSSDILDLEKLPHKLVVVGGGVIGMEMAFVFANFGAEVFVVEYMDKILAMLDNDIVREITSSALSKGIKLYTGSKVCALLEGEDSGCIVSFEQKGRQKYIAADKVLMCVGRLPNIEGIDIEKLGIELNENGRGIKVNSHMQTNIPNIYAIGDVTNKIMLAHAASNQGIVAVKNIMGQPKKMDYGAVPSAIFTDPEIAAVGMGEEDAKKNNIKIEVGKFPFAANGKALTLGETKGFVKIIKESSSGKVVGGAIIGPHATDLISEITLAIKNGLTAESIIETIHAHPTTAESIHEAALSAEGGALHFV